MTTATRQLSMTETVRGKPFTSPGRYERDQQILAYMLEDLRATLGEMAEGAVTIRPHEPTEWTVMGLRRRLIICDPMRIGKRSKVHVVGFFGERRRDRDSGPLEQANAEIVLEFRDYPGILSYTSIELADGNWANLVIHDAPHDRERWRSSQRHAQVATALSPLYYVNVRIHNGHIPAGVMGGRSIILEADQVAFEPEAVDTGGRRAHRHHAAEIDPRQQFHGVGGEDPGEVVARADRVDLGGPGGDDNLVGLAANDPVGSADHELWSLVDPDHLLALVIVEDHHLASLRPETFGFGGPRLPTPDDGDVDLLQPGGDAATKWLLGQRRVFLDRLAFHHHPRAGLGPAHAGVADSVDDRQAVGAIPGQAEAPRGDLAGPQDGGQNHVAVEEADQATIENELRTCHVGRR
jgi:hypothetical protein